jgi:hypothetical protein
VRPREMLPPLGVLCTGSGCDECLRMCPSHAGCTANGGSHSTAARRNTSGWRLGLAMIPCWLNEDDPLRAHSLEDRGPDIHRCRAGFRKIRQIHWRKSRGRGQAISTRRGSGSGTFEKVGQRKAALYVAAISLTSASAGVTGLWTTMPRTGRPLAKTLTSARAVLRMHPILPAIGREEALARRKDEVKRHKASS